MTNKQPTHPAWMAFKMTYKQLINTSWMAFKQLTNPAWSAFKQFTNPAYMVSKMRYKQLAIVLCMAFTIHSQAQQATITPSDQRRLSASRSIQ